MNFNILGVTKTYPDSFAPAAKSFGFFLSASQQTGMNFNGMYSAVKNIQQLLFDMGNQGMQISNDMAAKAVEVLASFGITMTPADFLQKYGQTYGLDYRLHIQVVQNSVNQTLSFLSQRFAMKQGGYLNPDGSLPLDGQAKSELNALYRDERTRQMMCGGISMVCSNTYTALLAELIEQGKADASVYFDMQGAYQDFNMGNAASAIVKYPGDKNFYDAIFQALATTETDDFERYLDFFGLEFFYPGLADMRLKSREFDQTMAQSALSNFDFNNLQFENINLLREKLKEMGYTDINTIPMYSNYANAIRSIVGQVSILQSTYMNAEFVKHLPKSLTIEQFFGALREERDFMFASPYKALWLNGDLISEANPLSPKMNVMQMVNYENDTVFMNLSQGMMKGKGIMITSRFIIDVKTNLRIPIQNVVDIFYDGLNQIRITDGVNVINLEKLSQSVLGGIKFEISQQRDSLIHCMTGAFVNMLKLFCIRYGGNQYLIQQNPYLM